ncbi:SURF1 family protein [Alteromonas sp. C1M14]|uniref:SURF1 family protein n=1 Tax=Alteromonas sp. C1M14 TaxID=2841567 RepID=UPI001C08504C|nr:SURF1 family protein [Alteromonas sp. C1M14]MBU2978373.1 SURF1 family protein [Alteromonas sp. C1M14]
MNINERYTLFPTTALIGMAIIAMICLGFWQLDRMHQKEIRLASITQKSQQSAISLDALDPRREDIRDYQVGFNGEVDTSQLLYLDNRVESGRVGFDIIAPVVTNEGIVLVNFGWVEAPLSREYLPRVNIRQGFRHFHGRITVPQNNPVVRETLTAGAAFPAIIQQVDIAFIRKLTGMNIAPFVVELTTPTEGEFVRSWQPVVMPPQKHLGYAIQWFGLAAAAGMVGYFALTSKNKG